MTEKASKGLGLQRIWQTAVELLRDVQSVLAIPVCYVQLHIEKSEHHGVELNYQLKLRFGQYITRKDFFFLENNIYLYEFYQNACIYYSIQL